MRNFGDPILFESTKYLIKEIINDNSIIIEDLDLFGDDDISAFRRIVSKVLNKVNRIFKINPKFNYFFEKRIIQFSVIKYYEKKLSGTNYLIFAGGGLIKYKYETCDYRLSILTELANKKSIPVAFNAVGVEGYSETNIRCQEMKRALNSNVVKLITTRDDIELLNKYYITNLNIITHKVADSAF